MEEQIKTQNISAAIYIRLSKKEKETGSLGLEVQESECKTYCEKHNLTIYKIYKDDGISASLLEERTGLQELLKAAKEKKFKKIIFWKLDRFVRDDDMLGYIKYDTLRPNDIEIEATAEDIKHKFVQKFRSMQAEEERENISKRIIAGFQIRGDKGQYCHRLAIGYKRDENKRLILDKDKAAIIQKIFNMYVDGESINNIVKEFNLTRKQIHDMLHNKIYIGERISNYGKIDVPKIIDKETFDKAQERLKKNSLLLGRNYRL